MKQLIIILVLSLFFGKVTFAQNKFQISGYVKDARSGESLQSASINILGTNTTVTSNSYGFFSLSLKEGTYTLIVNYSGYERKEVDVNLTKNESINIELQQRSKETKAAVVTAKKKDQNVKSTNVGIHQLTMESVKKIPVILGETDILKTIQLLPGVKNGGEGQAGFYVRGGSADQNLIVLDDATVYNSGHLFGFFSVFNGDAIKNVTLYKGGIPAEFGGRLSSVLDITMKDGNNKQLKMQGGIGLIASRFSIEGPIKKEVGSFMISARRTYIDALAKPFVKSTSPFKGSGYYFYDLNAKANYRLSDKDKLYLSGYFGKDVFTFNSKNSNFKINIPWGNTTATLRWNHLFNSKLFMNTTLLYNDYNFKFGAKFQNTDITLTSGIRDWNLKFDMDYYLNNKNHIKFGAISTYHTFKPSVFSATNDSVDITPDNPDTKFALESAAYVQNDFDLTDKIKINAGMRYSNFSQFGAYIQYTYFNNQKIDSINFAKGSVAKSYGGFEPRINTRFTTGQNSSIKASVGKTYQYIHLVSNNGSTLPTDLWVPSTGVIQPQKSWQYSLGYFQNLKQNSIETSVEVYYKDMFNQLEYREGYTPNTTKDPEYDFVTGNGWAYGAEFFVNKVKGKWTGWVGYTLSWTWRNFKNLNSGDNYLAKFDRRHDISILNTYEINKKWTLSSVFIYSTGNRVSIPSSVFVIENTLLQQFDKLNNFVLPAYHRLDLGATYTPIQKKARKWNSSWNFSIYNVYSRMNPYFIYLDTEGNANTSIKVKVKQVSIFPILPSVTYNFNF